MTLRREIVGLLAHGASERVRMAEEKKTLLVYPGKLGAFKPEIPVQLLYLASVLRENGHPCEIFDMRLTDIDLCDLSDCLCVGITCMTGTMIRYGLQFAEIVRAFDGTIPIIWGGVHPSLLPEQTVVDPRVDVVVRGEGERTLVELVEALSSGGVLGDVAGITMREDGGTVSTPDRPFLDMNDLPIELPYDLLEMDRYETSVFPIHTSRGCPYRCTFCYNQGFNRGSFRYKPSGRVLDEVDDVVSRFPIETVTFACEDNFFTRRKRVEEICSGLLERGHSFKWEAFCRFDTFSGFDEEFISLMERSGGTMLSFGGESGNQEILDRVIEKGTTIQQIIDTSAKIRGTGFTQMVSFMVGIPGETDEDLRMTMNLVDRILEVNPAARIVGLVFYTPFPGNKLFDEVVNRYSFKPPSSLEEWADYKIFRDVKCTWLPKRRAKMLQRLSVMTRFPFYTDDPVVPPRLNSFPFRQAYLAMTKLARLRWKHRFFRFPLEWVLVEKAIERMRGFV